MILKEGDVSEIHMYIEPDMARNKMDCHTREWGFLSQKCMFKHMPGKPLNVENLGIINLVELCSYDSV